MATLEQLERALIEADRAGNAADARVLAREVSRLRQEGQLSPEMAGLKQETQTPGLTVGEKFGIAGQGMYEKAKDMLQTMGIRGAPVALGDVVGRRVAGPVGAAGGRALGGAIGSASDQARLMREGKQEDFSFGELAGDVVGAVVPGRGPVSNALGNVAAVATESMVEGEPLDTTRMMVAASGGAVGATASRMKTGKIAAVQEKLFEERMRPFRDLRKEGFVINPDEIGASTMGGTRLAGKAMLGQTASQQNQYGVQRLSREDLGLSKEAVPFRPDKLVGGKIVPGELEVVIKESYEPYETIKSISERARKEGERFFKISDPHESAVMRSTPEGQKLLVEAAADVDALKNARISERDAWRRLKSNEPNAYDAWKQAKETVKNLDDRITAAAESAGDPKLAERLKDSRQKISKAYAYMNATDKTTGLVDLRDLAAQFNDDAFLTGNARRMAEFYNAFSRNAQEAVRGQPPGGEHLGINFAAVSAAQGNPVGMTLAGVPFMRGPASRAIFSEFAQNRFAQPRMQLGPEDFTAAMLRYAPQVASRRQEMLKDEDLQRFLQQRANRPITFNRQ